MKGIKKKAHGIAGPAPQSVLLHFEAPFLRAFLLTSKSHTILKLIKRSSTQGMFFPIINFFP